MKVKNEVELREIMKELESLQRRVTDCIVLEDNELNQEYDIYNQIREVVENIENVLEEVQEWNE